QVPSRPRMPSRSGPATGSGRWSLLPPVESDPTIRALATAEQLLDRYGVLTRGSVVAEGIEGGFAGVYRVLAGAEEAGRVRRGYFIEHLGAAQFGTSGAVDRMRALSETPASGPTHREQREERAAGAVVLAATDPANPYGASIPWPEGSQASTGDQAAAQGGGTHRPGRKAGALVALVEGRLALYLERGGRTALTFSDDAEDCARVAAALAELVKYRGVAALTVKKVNGHSALTSDHALAQALVDAGFHTAPQGLRLRR
ncbi:MAG: DEAD/DEAH box helicase, partial [Ornithinimicrobium sp.]